VDFALPEAPRRRALGDLNGDGILNLAAPVAPLANARRALEHGWSRSVALHVFPRSASHTRSPLPGGRGPPAGLAACQIGPVV